MTILTKEQWETSVAEAWSASIKATYQHLIDEAVKAEREACAKIVENEAWQYTSPVWAVEIVNDIRARGQA